MLEFFAGFCIGGGLVGLACYFYGKRVGLAIYQTVANLSAAGKDLKKGL